MNGEIDYGELFGVDEGVEEQEVTAPADTEEPQGEEGQEVAVPAEDTDDMTSDGNDDADELEGDSDDGCGASASGDGEAVGKPKQSAEENARYAAARRKAEAERDAAISKAREDAKAEADKFIAEVFTAAGLINPYTGKPITTKEELASYREKNDEARRSEFLRKSGVSEDELTAFINDLPEVKAAKAAEATAAAAKKAADEAAAKSKLEGEIREISAIDPSIKSLYDLTKHESYRKVYELVGRGNSLVDAFKLANYEALTKGAASSAKRAAVNSARSKSHMTSTQTRGAGAVSVPREIMEEYRALMPDITDAEIRAHYQKNHK